MKALYAQIFKLFLSRPIPDEVLEAYLADPETVETVTDHIGAYLKKEFSWMTNISVLDMVEVAIRSAASNGNLRHLNL